jgi:hypothetical protein
MGQRLDLQELLETLLGSENVYFQPPPNFSMSYPCIVYNRSNIRSRHGDNQPYKLDNQYTITVIDSNPDSEIPIKVAKLPQCIFDRHFTADNLNHDVFNIIF